MKRSKLNPVVSPEMLTLGEAEGVAIHASNRSGIAKTRTRSRPGVADGIEQSKDEESTRRAAVALDGTGLSRRVCRGDREGALQKAGSNGMETG